MTPRPQATRPLPPDLDVLRREVRLKLAALQETMPLARMSQVRGAIARDYGYADFGALKDAVARQSQAASRHRLRRTSFRPGARLDAYEEPLRHPAEMEPFDSGFLRAGIKAQLIFAGVIGTIMVILFGWRAGML